MLNIVFKLQLTHIQFSSIYVKYLKLFLVFFYNLLNYVSKNKQMFQETYLKEYRKNVMIKLFWKPICNSNSS